MYFFKRRREETGCTVALTPRTGPWSACGPRPAAPGRCGRARRPHCPAAPAARIFLEGGLLGCWLESFRIWFQDLTGCFVLFTIVQVLGECFFTIVQVLPRVQLPHGAAGKVRSRTVAAPAAQVVFKGFWGSTPLGYALGTGLGSPGSVLENATGADHHAAISSAVRDQVTLVPPKIGLRSINQSEGLMQMSTIRSSPSKGATWRWSFFLNALRTGTIIRLLNACTL